MNLIKEFIEIVKQEEINTEPEIPAMYIINVPYFIMFDSVTSSIPGIKVEQGNYKEVVDNFLQNYGNVQYMSDIVINSLIISFHDFMNLYILDPKILLQIYKRNLDIINFILNNTFGNNISLIDMHLINNKKIKNNIFKEDELNTIYTIGHHSIKLLIYINSLLKKLNCKNNNKIIKQEIYLTSHSIATRNLSNNIDSLYKINNPQNCNKLVDIEISFKLKSELRDILKKIKLSSMIPILDRLSIEPNTLSMLETDCITITLLQIHILLNYYSKVILISNSEIYKRIINFVTKAGYKAYKDRILFIKIDEINFSIYQIIETFYWLQNPYIVIIFEEKNLFIQESIISISNLFKKQIIGYKTII